MSYKLIRNSVKEGILVIFRSCNNVNTEKNFYVQNAKNITHIC